MVGLHVIMHCNGHGISLGVQPIVVQMHHAHAVAGYGGCIHRCHVCVVHEIVLHLQLMGQPRLKSSGKGIAHIGVEVVLALAAGIAAKAALALVGHDAACSTAVVGMIKAL